MWLVGRLSSRSPRVRRELNVLALVKGNERFVFVYDDDSREELIEVFRNLAADPEAAMSWFDAAILTDKAREQARTAPTIEPLTFRF